MMLGWSRKTGNEAHLGNYIYQGGYTVGTVRRLGRDICTNTAVLIRAWPGLASFQIWLEGRINCELYQGSNVKLQ